MKPDDSSDDGFSQLFLGSFNDSDNFHYKQFISEKIKNVIVFS